MQEVMITNNICIYWCVISTATSTGHSIANEEERVKKQETSDNQVISKVNTYIYKLKI